MTSESISPVSGKAEEMPDVVSATLESVRAWLTGKSKMIPLDAIDTLQAIVMDQRAALDRAEREIAGYRKALGLLVESDPLSGRASLPQHGGEVRP